jgi:hypothetical protein
MTPKDRPEHAPGSSRADVAAPTTRRPGRLTLPRIWALAALAGIFLAANLIPVTPNDFWWHVRAGQWIVEHGRTPTTDLFSFTRLGEPWTYQSWLAEIAYSLVMRAGGLPLVILLHAIILTAAYALLLLTCRRAALGDLRSAALATLLAAFGSPNWNVRPQSVSILLFAVTLFLVERNTVRQVGQRAWIWQDPALWLLPPLFVLWANAHGGFVFGLVLLGSYLLARGYGWIRHGERFPAQLAMVTLLCALATLVTPSGPGMLDYVLGFVRHPATVNLNVEFMPPTIRSLDGQLFFGFVILWFVLLLAARYRPSARDTIRLLVFGVLALMARRNMIWFCMVAAPPLAASLHTWVSRMKSRSDANPGRSWINVALVALIGALAVLSLPWFRPYLPIRSLARNYVAAGTPTEAVAHLCRDAQARRTFHEQRYGSYLIWACPDLPVFIDTRIELYPLEQWDDYLAASAGRYDWEAILDRYRIDTLLLDKEAQKPLIDAAKASPRWRVTYEDEQTVIFEKTGTRP